MPALAFVWAGSIAMVFGLYLASALAGLSASHLTRDPLSVAESWLEGPAGGTVTIPPYLGAVSNLGMVLWSVGCGVSFVSWIVLRRSRWDDGWSRFFLGAGAVSTILLVDDLFMVHERIVRDLLGIGELWVLAVYGAIVGLFLWTSRKEVLRTDMVLLLHAGFFFLVSVAVDNFAKSLPHHHLVEDGAKFVGILSWTVFLVVAAGQRLTGRWGAVHTRPRRPRYEAFQERMLKTEIPAWRARAEADARR